MRPRNITTSIHMSQINHQYAINRNSQQKTSQMSFHHNMDAHKKSSNLNAKSQIFSIYQNRTIRQQFVEARGQNQDILQETEIWNYQKFLVFIQQLPFQEYYQLILQIFNHMKKWLYIYGLIQFSKCIFLLKNQQFIQWKSCSEKILIIYLSKKQVKKYQHLSIKEKQKMFLEQFLIMFKKAIFQTQKPYFNSIQEFQEFFLLKWQKLQKRQQNNKNCLSNQFSYAQNSSMKGSYFQDQQNLMVLNRKKYDKSMMIIQQRSSQYLSPKKPIASSGYYESISPLKNSQTNITVNSKNNIINNSVSQFKKINNYQIKVKQIKNNVPFIRFNYLSPTNKTKQNVIRAVSHNQLNNDVKREITSNQYKNSINMLPNPKHQDMKIRSYNSAQSIGQFKNVNNILFHMQNQKMKQTNTTLNTYQFSSANYLPANSLNSSGLRNSLNSDHFTSFHHQQANHPGPIHLTQNSINRTNIGQYRNHINFNNSKSYQNEQKGQLFETRTRNYSDFKRKNLFQSSLHKNDKLFQTTRHIPYRISSKISQNLDQMKISSQKIYKISQTSNKISQQSNNHTENNQNSYDDRLNIQDQLQNLFGGSFQEQQNDEQMMENLIMEFQQLLGD